MSQAKSKLEPFTLILENSATLSGLVHEPCILGPAGTHRPLIVLLHGGGCHAGYFNVSDDHTALLISEALSVPIVAINRPCYAGTSSIYPIPEGSSFHKETGRWEHEYIFPAVWQNYGLPNQCSSLVVAAHSLATPGLLVAASLYSQSGSNSYPLAGLIISGWGCRPNVTAQNARLAWTKEERESNRHLLMLSDSKLHTADGKMKTYLTAQTVDPPPEEAQECVAGPWMTYFPRFARCITIPIMFGIGEHDWLWQGTHEHISEFSRYFPNCPRFDGSVVQGAPHAIEWSYYGLGWYTRCFGFALEAAAYFTIKQSSEED